MEWCVGFTQQASDFKFAQDLNRQEDPTARDQLKNLAQTADLNK
jgi:hypothetical protein